MQAAWPYVSFVLGALFAFLLQWVAYRLSVRKDQEKEYWIRKLNSYQDFHHHASQLIELVDSGVVIPEDVYWQSISLARKAAYDAGFYDRSRPKRTAKMKAITIDLIRLLNQRTAGLPISSQILAEVDGIKDEFYREEKLLGKTS